MREIATRWMVTHTFDNHIRSRSFHDPSEALEWIRSRTEIGGDFVVVETASRVVTTDRLREAEAAKQ